MLISLVGELDGSISFHCDVDGCQWWDEIRGPVSITDAIHKAQQHTLKHVEVRK